MGALVQEKARELFVEGEIPEELAWIAWLSPDHQRLFREELYDAIQAARPEDELTDLLASWIATAELDHSPEVQQQIERNRASSRFASVDEWLKKKKIA